MLESCFDAIIWYVFEGAQRQISLFLFSIIIQTIQLFDHFHEKFHEVSSSSKFESCLRVQKLGTQPWTQYFQGSSHQQLEKCLVYSIFYVFHLGTSLGKGAFSPNWYQDETRRILATQSSTWKFIITMAPPTKTLAAPGNPSPPHQVCAVSLGSLHCVHCKKTGCFCS
jgi:hypothetical protein